MKRSGFARLMAVMLAAGLAFGMLSSCSDDNDDDDGPSLVDTIYLFNNYGEVIFVANFYDNTTWVAYTYENVKVMDGTYTGNIVPSGAIIITASHYLDDDGNWYVASSKPAQIVRLGADGTITNLDDLVHWLNTF